MVRAGRLPVGWFALVLVLGCSQPAAERSSDIEPAQAGAPAPRETWDVLTIGGRRAGSVQTTWEREDRDGQPAWRIRGKTLMQVKRFDAPAEMSAAFDTWETADGRLFEFSSEMALGGEPVLARGKVENGKLHIDADLDEKKVARVLDWPAGAGGYAAVQLSLLDAPLQPGERREVRGLEQIDNRLATYELTAGKHETTDMLEGDRKLLKVACRTRLGSGAKIDQTFWLDGQGDILKTEMPGDIVIYRTTERRALQDPSQGAPDIGYATLVPLPQRLARPEEAASIVYVVRVDQGAPAELCATDFTQRVHPLDDRRAEVEVRRASADAPLDDAWPVGEPPKKADLASSLVIQSADPRIVELAGSVAAGEQDPALVALALEGLVREYIQTKSYAGPAFSTALETLESRSGDCTEHAVLLISLARARKIPARAALGLCYIAEKRSFGYHMWAEAYVGDRWLPFDATRARWGATAARIKLAHTSLGGDAPYQSLTPVMQAIGNLHIEEVREN